ncbi:MAG: UDP-2,4-diacetamido-2,4,6-trideoxy-beta-L-altropyranose hydrolase [Cyclobacteriaceae bacterium]
MRQKIYIRADGGGTIGMGHLIRCGALADMLSESYDLLFVLKEAPESFYKSLSAKAYEIKSIQSEQGWISTLQENDLVVLDGYHFGIEIQQAIKSKHAKLIMIDDLAEKPLLADVIINHAPGLRQDDYAAISEKGTVLALGSEYALLRQEFLQAAQSAPKPISIKNLFICFGGADMHDFTGKALSAALKLDCFDKINVVIGPSYAYEKSLNEFCESCNRQVRVFKDISSIKMLEVMQQSGLAIVPASSVLFEALAAGLICLSGAYVDNQQRILQGFLQSGAVFEIKDLNNIEIELTSWHQNFNPVLTIVNPIDGKSNFRILELFNRLTS